MTRMRKMTAMGMKKTVRRIRLHAVGSVIFLQSFKCHFSLFVSSGSRSTVHQLMQSDLTHVSVTCTPHRRW